LIGNTQENLYISINKQIKEFNKKYKLPILKIDKDNITEISWLEENEREEFILLSIHNNEAIESEFEGDIENIVDIVLPDLDMGDEMLKYLFLILTYKSKNKVQKLVLRNNKLKDPSILSRINFNKLKVFDLAVNEITNIKFLSDMKAENLEYLFLDNNHLSSIYPLFNTNFPNLEILSLNGNYFNYDNLEEILKYKDLKDKGKIKEIFFFDRNELLIQFSDHIKLFNNESLNISYYCKKKI